MPSSGSFRKLYDFINENESRLEAALLEYPKRNYIDESFRFKTLTFDVSVTRSDVSNFYLTLSNGQLRIACPSDTDFHSDEVQERLKKMIGSALRHEAKRILPKRLDELAGKHGFSYAEVKINGSRTHWGSCTSRKNINLSYSLLLLPPNAFGNCSTIHAATAQKAFVKNYKITGCCKATKLEICNVFYT